MTHILISGAGIAGLSLARQLRQLGMAFTLIDKKPNFDTSIQTQLIIISSNYLQASRALPSHY